jgi:hypothetical protein
VCGGGRLEAGSAKRTLIRCQHVALSARASVWNSRCGVVFLANYLQVRYNKVVPCGAIDRSTFVG